MISIGWRGPQLFKKKVKNLDCTHDDNSNYEMKKDKKQDVILFLSLYRGIFRSGCSNQNEKLFFNSCFFSALSKANSAHLTLCRKKIVLRSHQEKKSTNSCSNLSPYHLGFMVRVFFLHRTERRKYFGRVVDQSDLNK